MRLTEARKRTCSRSFVGPDCGEGHTTSSSQAREHTCVQWLWWNEPTSVARSSRRGITLEPSRGDVVITLETRTRPRSNSRLLSVCGSSLGSLYLTRTLSERALTSPPISPLHTPRVRALSPCTRSRAEDRLEREIDDRHISANPSSPTLDFPTTPIHLLPEHHANTYGRRYLQRVRVSLSPNFPNLSGSSTQLEDDNRRKRTWGNRQPDYNHGAATRARLTPAATVDDVTSSNPT